jgi:hypothetical protein
MVRVGRLFVARFVDPSSSFSQNFAEQILDLAIDAAHFLLRPGFQGVVDVGVYAEQE